MPSTTSSRFGDVVLVPFPFTDHSTTKKRPAVVVSSDRYHAARPDVILMAVSSQVRTPAPPGELPILDWRAAGLLKPSVLKPLLATIEARIIIRTLGSLKPNDRAALRAALDEILGT